jgi:hypothetical protein
MRKLLQPIALFSLFSLFACSALFSCSDMGESPNAVTERELPSDFDATVYATINPDVPHSQLVFALADSSAKVSSETAKADCKAFLGSMSTDSAFMAEVYLEYLGCPRQALDTTLACPAPWSNNPAYYKSEKAQCVIPGCWVQGWDDDTKKGAMIVQKDSLVAQIEADSLAHPEVCDIPNPTEDDEKWCDLLEDMRLELDTLKKKIDTMDSSLVKNWSLLVTRSGKLDAMASAMCLFNLVPGGIEADKRYLDAFQPDSFLVERHYVATGRIEGRPYRYCDGVEKGAKRTEIEPNVLSNAGGTARLFDYSANLFCFETSDSLIYAIK